MKTVLDVEITKEALALFTDVTYANSPFWYGESEKPLKMSIICPKHKEGHNKQPLVVWICGGAYKITDRNVWIPEMMTFASSGYTVASIEYRTSNNAPFPSAIIDVKSAIRYLNAHALQYCIDSSRIAVLGESAGGSLASFIGVTQGIPEFDKGDWLEYSSNVSSVVDYYGITDMLEEPLHAVGENKYVIQEFLYNQDGIDLRKKASVLSYISDDRDIPPFLILHGLKDELVPISQSRKLYEKLISTGHYADLYEIKNAPHGSDYFYQEVVNEIVKKFMKNAGC